MIPETGKSTSKNSQTSDIERKQARLIPDFFEWISDGLVVFDAQMNFIYVNQKGGEIFGRRPETLTGKNYLQEFPDAKGTAFAKTCQQALETQSQAVLDEYHKPLARWFQHRLYPSENGLAVCYIDITEYKKVETALQKSEEKYRHLVETAHDLIWAVDAQGKITFINQAARDVYGYEPDELIGRSYVEFLSPEERALQADYSSQGNAPEDAFVFGQEVEIIHRDGTRRILLANAVRIFDEDGNVLGSMGTSADITERRKAEDALRENTEFMVNLMENSPVAIYITGTDNRIQLVNKQWEQGTGIPRANAIEHSLDQIFPADIAERLKQDNQRVIETGTSIEFEEIINSNRYLTVKFPLRDGAGRVVSVGGISIDVTERVQAQEEKKRQAARAETLARTAGRLNKQLDLDAVIQSVCQEALETFGASQCAIALFNEEYDWLAYAGGINVPPDEVEKMEPIPRAQFEEITRVMGPQVIIPNVQEVPGLPNAELNARQDIRTVAVSTMARDQQLIGTITLAVAGRVRSFTLDEQSLLKALSDQAAQAIVNAKLLKTANEQRAQLRILSAKLAEAQEVERRALTRELHDRVGQNLTALSINLQNLKSLLSGEAAQEITGKFDDAQDLVQETTRHIRDIMAELHPPELEDYGLAAALETYAERAASRGNLKLSANLPELPSPLPPDFAIILFRAAQEAINNVLKHARATRLKVSLRERDDRIRIRVEDNGRGFEPDLSSRKEAQTWGLKMMQERIESIGGSFLVESIPGKGTRITLDASRPTS